MSKQLQVGQPLQELKVQTADGQETTVNNCLSPTQSLLYFLHGTWCPECVGQYHLLQRYQSQIEETGTKLIVITGEDSGALSAFLNSTHPALEYTILTDPKRETYRSIGAGNDMISLIVDGKGLIRWVERWPKHEGEPSYEVMLQAVHNVRNTLGSVQ